MTLFFVTARINFNPLRNGYVFNPGKDLNCFNLTIQPDKTVTRDIRRVEIFLRLISFNGQTPSSNDIIVETRPQTIAIQDTDSK